MDDTLREMGADASLNVFGAVLEPCSTAPMTGFFRNGCCDTAAADRGSHTVCAVLTAEFLAFSKARGNDLSTPRPEYGFPGLNPGDRWCLCAARWMEAHDAGAAPRVRLASTHARALEICPMEVLRPYALDLS
jgi:uncharacterized protein (DUF2237 family)